MASSVIGEASTSGMYQCGICKKDYKRLDHLSRHTRSHTQSRPHKCRLCPKTFTRTDLLKRHVAAHERHSARLGHDVDAGPSDSEGIPPLGRVSLACKACSANHLRCTDDKPCERCVSKGIECVWDTAMDPEQVFTPPITEGDRTQGEEPSPSPARASATARPDEWQTSAVVRPDLEGESLCVGETSTVNQHDGMLLGLPNPSSAPLPFFDEFPSLDLLSAQWPQAEAETGGGVDTGMSGPFEGIQFPFPETYDFMSFEMSYGQNQPHNEPTSRGSSDPGQPAAMCTEAFRNSHWHFRPGTKDYAGADDHNLSLPQDSGFDSPDSPIILSAAVPRHVLSVATRDRILTMVVKTANPAHLPQAVAYFPSTQLLSTLVHLYLHSPISRATSFLHAPTFDPNNRRPEMLAAMAASGAVLTSNPALVKVGFAIAEIARMAITGLWDSDNTLVRDLQLLQAFYITLELGLWSGHGRRVEIAESFLQPLVTMVRRAGYFRCASYTQPSMAATTYLDSDEASSKWLAWVELESFKRLAFRLLQHDTNASMALLVNPIISYTEVELPIPDSVRLWSAATRGRWELGYPSLANNKLLTVGDLIDDPDILTKESETIDRAVASRAMISLVWMLTWEYTRMVSFQKLQPRQFNALVTKLRLDELRKLLETLAISLASEMHLAPDLAMRLELIHLHLHMPFEDIQTFAGMQGAEQARAVYPSIRDWSLSESARRAVYHAGQVIRASRNLPQTFVQGVEAIMVYHASLAFWVYGLLGEKYPVATTERQAIYLDDVEEGIVLRRFLEFGSGKPCIQSGVGKQGQDGLRHRAAVHLNRPDAVLEEIIHVVQRNFRSTDIAHLTQKLIHLMQELGKAARRSLRHVPGE